MDVYIYGAALYCDACGESIRDELRASGDAPSDPEDEHTYDSDDYPKGPYPDGGGEADSPQHCDGCGVFLENPLTDDRYRYLLEMLREGWDRDGSITGPCAPWVEHYQIEVCEEHGPYDRDGGAHGWQCGPCVDREENAENGAES
jgi:hypothetical protein